MKRLRCFISVLLFFVVMCINARKPHNIYIIDGYFFNEIPTDKTLINGLLKINTQTGSKATVLTLTQPLPEEAIKYALPIEQVPDAEQLLTLYNEKVADVVPIVMKREETLKVGSAFPPFQATDISGRMWTNQDVEGKVMVLNCWFTGCGPCRAEMPELSNWKDEMPDVVFFSSTYESGDIARPVLENTGFNWIPLVNDNLFKTYVGSNGYPMTVVIDKTGVVRQVEFGTSPIQREHLHQTIQSLRY